MTKLLFWRKKSKTEDASSTSHKEPGATRRMYQRAIVDAFAKLDPRWMIHNPVMFVTEVGSFLTTVLWVQALAGHGEAPTAFIGGVSLWLWLCVLFANFSEALAEGRGKAQAAALRRTRKETHAKKLAKPDRNSPYITVSSGDLLKDDYFLVETGDIIPTDGEIVEGVASVDESAVTGESAPVIRESGGDRSAVTGGTRVLSDWLVVKVSASPGEGFLDRMISLVEGAKRQKTPNEIALMILIAGFTIIFLVVCATLLPYSLYIVKVTGSGKAISVTVLVALLVCLIPTTIGGLLPAIGIAGMDRLIRKNESRCPAGLLRQRGMLTCYCWIKRDNYPGKPAGSRVYSSGKATSLELAEAAQEASLADETPEGRSIVLLAKEKYGLKGTMEGSPHRHFIPFTAQTRMSGIDADGLSIRKGAVESVLAYVKQQGKPIPSDLNDVVEKIARGGGTPLVVERNGDILGVVHLKDIVKGGIKERFIQMRKMGIKTIMITGDNPLTAAAIAAEAGVDDFLAQATPETKLALIRANQEGGKLVAMTGDGTNDAPALAQADVAVAMHTGTQPAREAANMIDLDSNPTKLIDIVETGKQLLMTRGALTTFSIANDVSKYFAIIPAAFGGTLPALKALNVMHLATPESAVLSAVIFNALIIMALVPLALRGVPYRAVGAARLLRDNLFIYGLGGVIAPFIGIKLIDMLLVALHIV